jgi:hypothetical protein
MRDRGNRRAGRLLVVGGLLVSAAAAGWAWESFGTSPAQAVADPGPGSDSPGPVPMAEFPPSASLVLPGVREPPAVPAPDARLADDEPVIGVRVRGRPRAYKVRALYGPHRHVVNDVVRGTPVTVTHCDADGCTRVYTGPGGDPLDVGVGGFIGGLILHARGRFYYQETGRAYDPDGGPPAIPYDPLPFEETNWGTWRAAHPDTDVYLGPGAGP